LIAAVAIAGCPAIHAEIQVGAGDLQKAIDAAPPHSTIVCDPNRELTLSTPIKIDKPLTLRRLHARLPEKLGNPSLLLVTSKAVTVSEFELTGNGDTVSPKERAPLMVIAAGEFRVENGRFNNSSKDGVMIDGDTLAAGDIVGGVVRDIVGNRVSRDVV